MATQPPPRHTTRIGSFIDFLRRTQARSVTAAPYDLPGIRIDLRVPRSGEGSRTLLCAPSDRARSTDVERLLVRRPLPGLARVYLICGRFLSPRSPDESLATATSSGSSESRGRWPAHPQSERVRARNKG